MLEEVKLRLLESPETIEHILEIFGFDKIRTRQNEIRAAREYGSNPTAVVIKLVNNDNLFVIDYELSLSLDLINYLIRVKNAEFKTIIEIIKQELGVDSVYSVKKTRSLFGGIYERVMKPDSAVNIKTHPESILDTYLDIPSKRWIDDGISIQTQRKWKIRYDVESQRIVFPIRTPEGEIMAIKGRANEEVTDENPKYLYIEKGPMSQTLFGYSDNYNSLYENDVFIFESEKSVLKLDSWGYNNAVALGNNSLTPAQAKLLLHLNPKSIVFMLDKDLPLQNTIQNVEVFQSFCGMKEVPIYYWDWRNNLTLDEKCAPVDDSKEEFENILRYEIEEYKGGIV